MSIQIRIYSLPEPVTNAISVHIIANYNNGSYDQEIGLDGGQKISLWWNDYDTESAKFSENYKNYVDYTDFRLKFSNENRMYTSNAK